MSEFACLTGENNSGKSSFLLALRLLVSGSALPQSDYFDPQEDIRIEIGLSQIDDQDLLRIAPEHRERITDVVKDGILTLVRVYGNDGKSKLLYRTDVPKDERFSEEAIRDLTYKQKAGEPFANKVADAFPELKDKVTASMNQADVKNLIQTLVEAIPKEQLREEDRPLPTGIDSSIKHLLPEPIYLPAVKDLSDDTKTKETATFGKVLGILLDQIKDKLADTDKLFETLNRQLNPVKQEDGSVVDDRLSEVQDIESTVERYIQESFADVKVRISIPPPQLKTVLQNAEIYANDGVDGLIETKGDGLRRAMVFSILRSYVELRQRHEDAQAASQNNETGNVNAHRNQPVTQYLLLFEEPELYLHPQAQLVLFDALRSFSEQHSVVVTTHSPAFFGPNATKTFVKLRKVAVPDVPKPFTHATPIDLTGLSERDQFQIICYENNNAAFFADHVILVEGPSDHTVLPHIAALLNPAWNPARSSIRFARIGGKSSIRKYRDFFGRFGSTVSVIADLDVLVNGFEQLEAGEDLCNLRSELLQAIDNTISSNGEHTEMSQKGAKALHSKADVKAQWYAMKQAYDDAKADKIPIEEAHQAAHEFFALERKQDRLAALQDCTDPSVLEKKHRLLMSLRDQSIFVLSGGAIEDYYPDTIPSGDKASRAQAFCKTVRCRDTVLACCGDVPDSDGGDRNEFELIFKAIFDTKNTVARRVGENADNSAAKSPAGNETDKAKDR